MAIEDYLLCREFENEMSRMSKDILERFDRGIITLEEAEIEISEMGNKLRKKYSEKIDKKDANVGVSE